ncbi:methyl-accepting chemotaxis protein [Rhizobium leguminosarum]|uniref:methyl-accepting chemotaxis protein n=2 Tax=Rhizobium leguminosarum TaxID=384 RepID=UPI003ECE6DC9
MKNLMAGRIMRDEMKVPGYKSIRTKIVIAMSLLLAVTLVPAGSFVWLSSKSNLESMSGEIMRQEAAQASNQVKALIAEYKGLTAATVALLGMQYEQGILDPVSIRNAMQAQMETFPDRYNAWFLSLPGSKFAQSPGNTTEHAPINKEGLVSIAISREESGSLTYTVFERVESADWYRIPVETPQKWILTEPWISPIASHPVIITSGRVIVANDRKVALQGYDLNLAQLSSNIAQMAPMGTGRISLLSQTGNWVVNSDNGLLAKPYEEAQGRAQLDAALATGSPQFVEDYMWKDGTAVRRMFFPFKIPDFNTSWVAVVDVPVATINAPLHRQLVAIGIAFLAVLVLVLLLGWLINRMVVKPIQRLSSTMGSLANGVLNEDFDANTRRDEIGDMVKAVQVFRSNAIERQTLQEGADASRKLADKQRVDREEQKAREASELQFAVENLAVGLLQLSEGNLAYRISDSFVESLVSARDNFNITAEKLEAALSQVVQSTMNIDGEAKDIRSAADNLARRTEQQAAAVEQTAAALEEVTTTVKTSAASAQGAGRLVLRTKNNAENSGEIVRHAVTAMERIEKSSSEISNIIGVIDEIAFQTNLLALNAGVEAARAGDAGKGFAVVAQEVRELAQRSANAAKEIKILINTSNEQVGQGVHLVRETGYALENIVSEVQEISLHVATIVENAQEQSSGLQQINIAVNQMDQDTQKNAAMVEETTAATHGMAQEVAALHELVSQFRLSNPRTEGPRSRIASVEREPSVGTDDVMRVFVGAKR